MLSALAVFLPMFSTSAAAPVNKTVLQNKVTLNRMLTTFSELRDAKIRLVPAFAVELTGEGQIEEPRVATYNTKTGTIFVQQDMNPFLFQETVIHEYCHHIDFSMLEKWQWERWMRLWYEHPNHVSEYSRVSPAESFAEWCSVYKYEQTSWKTYSGVEVVFNSPQAKFMDTIYPKYRKPQ